MANKKVEPEERKENLTIKIKRKNIEKLRKTKGYNNKLDKLIENNF